MRAVAERRGARNVYVFGSIARGDDGPAVGARGWEEEVRSRGHAGWAALLGGRLVEAVEERGSDAYLTALAHSAVGRSRLAAS